MNELLTSAQPVIAGDAAGKIMLGASALSFWGGVDAHTGCVIDRRHNLAGRCMTGRVLVLPQGAGSCSTTGILLEMIRIETAPAAIVCKTAEPLLCMASVIGASLYGRQVPVYTVSDTDYEKLAEGAALRVENGVMSLCEDA